MPRKLPWTRPTASATADNDLVRPSKKRRSQSPDIDARGNANGVSALAQRKRRDGRTPSTSPPPAPPPEEYMREGLSADDIWIMVEDEFLETARMFTQHLHHAEYKRLKQLVKSQNKAVIQRISRPVDATTPLSRETRKRLEAAARLKTQSEALAEFGASRDDLDQDTEDAPWMRDSRLAGLMTRPHDSSIRLAALTGARANTRASAGYTKARPVTPKRRITGSLEEWDRKLQGTRGKPTVDSATAPSSDGDDDLDAHISGRLKQFPPRPPGRGEISHDASSLPPISHARRARDRGSASESRNSSVTSSTSRAYECKVYESPPPPESSASYSVVKRKSSNSKQSPSWDALDDFPRRQALPSALAGRMARRRAEKAKKENEGGKAAVLDEIPTFLV